MKKNRAIITAVTSLVAVFATAAALDFTSYQLFDRENGSNVLCSIDPTCRSMTAAEKNFAKDMFGNEIDYRNVKIFNRAMLFWPKRDGALISAWGNSIYVTTDNLKTADFSTTDVTTKSIYLHELTHVWQATKTPDFVSSGIAGLLKKNFDYDALYNYDIEDHKHFSDFNLEQQAQIIEDYYTKRTEFYAATNGLRMDAPKNFTHIFNVRARAQCRVLDQYTSVISTVLPQVPDPRCAMYRPYERPNYGFEIP